MMMADVCTKRVTSLTCVPTSTANLSADAVAMARTYIENEFGKYLPESPNVYNSKEGAQEALQRFVLPTSIPTRAS